MKFQHRRHAGLCLASLMREHAAKTDLVVLALPRGGVPVAFELALALDAPLDVFVVRKLGVPGHEELALGAIASGGVRVLNEDIISRLATTSGAVEPIIERELKELQRREERYRKNQPALNLRGMTAILADDGIATGATMRAAAMALQLHRPQRAVIAVPVASPASRDELRKIVDEVVCVLTPDDFSAVGEFYEDFSQTGDDEVCALLAQAASRYQG